MPPWYNLMFLICRQVASLHPCSCRMHRRRARGVGIVEVSAQCSPDEARGDTWYILPYYHRPFLGSSSGEGGLLVHARARASYVESFMTVRGQG